MRLFGCHLLYLFLDPAEVEPLDRFSRSMAQTTSSHREGPFRSQDYDDDDEIAYFTVRWKTRELVLSTARYTAIGHGEISTKTSSGSFKQQRKNIKLSI